MRIHNTNISERSSYVKIISRIKPVSWTGLKDREKKKKPYVNIIVQHGRRTMETRGLNSEADLAMYNYWKFI